MSFMIAVDTNIVVYALASPSDPRSSVAEKLLDELDRERTVIPWQVVTEVGNVLSKKHRSGDFTGDPQVAVRALLERYELVLPDRTVVEAGWALVTRWQLQYWDAMLAAACIRAGVRVLYTEDVPSAPLIDGLRFVNPFGPR